MNLKPSFASWLWTASPVFDAFYQEFAPGIFTNTTFCNERLTTQHMFHRIDNFSQFNGASFGDGRYAYSGRVSGLPIYEDDGRYLLHLGAAYQWRKGSNPSDFNAGTVLPSTPNPALTQNTDLVRFRARPGMNVDDLETALPTGYRAAETLAGRYVVRGRIDPGVLSTITGWSIWSDNLPASSRASTSTAPPAANGTISRIGRLG